jgi:hypothetical protein
MNSSSDREMIAEETAAKIQNDRAQHHAAAIEKWHGTPVEGGNQVFFQLGVPINDIVNSTQSQRVGCN